MRWELEWWVGMGVTFDHLWDLLIRKNIFIIFFWHFFVWNKIGILLSTAWEKIDILASRNNKKTYFTKRIFPRWLISHMATSQIRIFPYYFFILKMSILLKRCYKACQFQGYNARKVYCSCVFSVHIWKPVLSGRNL